MSTALLIREVSRDSVSVIDPAYYINEGFLCPGNSDVSDISEDVHNSLDAQVKTCLNVHSLDCEDEGVHLLVQWGLLIPLHIDTISDGFLFVSKYI
jgi:hypothetical protein